ncbi:MAG: autotransporter domain-containing protein [Syntrophales bacterium]|nr:autotransporter domain-containing protein [Syntrophales bacterium]
MGKPRRHYWIYFWLCLSILFPGLACGDDLSPDYQRSITLSRQHADNPTGWVPDYPTSGSRQIFTITGNPATENAAFGLKYDSTYGDGKNYLIVRTLSKDYYYSGNYVNESGYYIKGGPATTNASWVTTGNDATTLLRDNGGTSANIVKLLERGLGMNNDGSHSAIVEYAVIADNDHILRPTKNPNIHEYLTTPGTYGTSASFAAKPADMSQATYDKYVGTFAQKGYYQYWKEKTYDSAVTSSNAFPWTQIGYTFFWGRGETLANIQGMSEFIVPGETPVQIYGIYAPQSYIYTLNKGGAFSTDSDAQYGNGFASFKIDGTCDTVWAGHRFQKNVVSDTTAPNKIIITSGGSVTGGQGILVWSLNYDVENSGVISGATANKFNISNTGNIAVLFKGDTSTSYGTPILTGVNRLTNSGTIVSPGTAIKAEAGDTLITNNPGGVISGGSYAIQTGAGNDTVTVKGGELTGKVNLGTGTDTFETTAGSNAKLNFTLNKDTAGTAQVSVKDAVSQVKIADNTTLAVTVGGTKNFQNADRFLVVDTNTLTVTPANLLIQNDSAVPAVTFSATKSDDGKQLYLVASRVAGYYGRNAGNASLGNVLDSLANSATGDMANVLGDLDRSGNAGNARRLEPNVNGGAMQASYVTMNKFTGTVVNRMDQIMAVRAAGNGKTGISAGDEAAGIGIWTQGFGAFLHQNQREGTNGYDASISGDAVGIDKYFFKHLLLGLSGGYAYGKATTADANTYTGADSYQGSLYGNFSRNDYYLNAILSYAYNGYDASRHIAFGTTNRTAKSKYDGQQYSSYLEGGHTVRAGGFAVTPLASVQYTRLHMGDYTETGAGDLNLHVESQSYNMFQTGLGAKLAYPLTRQEVVIIPEIHGKWLYDFIGDQQQATSTFTGTGASFVTKGFNPPKSSGNLGARLTLLTKYNLAFSLNYDFEWKEDFRSNSGYINIRYSF